MGTSIKRAPSGEGARLKALAEGLEKREVAVGWLESAKYPDGTPVAYVAAIQEYGHAPIPARPFMRPTVTNQSQTWGAIATKIAKTATSADQLLEVIGAKMAGDMRKAIAEVTDPPLSHLTLLARKHRQTTGNKVSGGRELGEIAKADGDVSGVSTKPLVDTNVMFATLTHIVRGATK